MLVMLMFSSSTDIFVPGEFVRMRSINRPNFLPDSAPNNTGAVRIIKEPEHVDTEILHFTNMVSVSFI